MPDDPVPDDPAPPSLRARRREELVEQIRAAGHHQLVEVGAAALSLRAVARDLGIAVSALYRYYASRDDLLTDLLVHAFDAHGDAVDKAARTARERGADRGRVLAAAYGAYRTWALAHPAEFGLAYGTPVPGYQAPGERTIRAGSRIGDALIGLYGDAFTAGRVDRAVTTARGRRLSATTRAQLRVLADRRGYGLPLGALALATDSFIRLHGFTSMEVFGLLRPIAPDASAWFEEVLAAELRTMGVRR